MKSKILFLGALLLTISVCAQNPVAQKYANQMSIPNLKDNLTILSADALEGRDTGSRGQKMAAAFIVDYFQQLGLAAPVNGSYYQPIDLYSTTTSEAYVKAGQDKFENYSGIIAYGSAETNGEVSIPVVFAGKGTEEDFKQVDVKDKAVLLFITETRLTDNKTVALAREKGAKLVLVKNTETLADFELLAGQSKNYSSGRRPTLEKPKPSTDAGIFAISPVAAEKLMGVTLEKLKAAAEKPKGSGLKKIKPATIQYKIVRTTKIIKTENVMGFLEGGDKKDEVVVITAHYDHIGKRANGEGDIINNGADDDGSGTVAVMEMARLFTEAKKNGEGPRRSILFMLFTGEEKGLLGSSYYSDHPVIPLEKTVVNLNIDMIGRKDAAHKDSAPYVYVIGSNRLSNELHELSENINKTYTNLIFDYTYNEESHPDRIYYRSDHWNFAKKNVPIIFYYDGPMEDYHKPSDSIEKIEFDLLVKRATCIFHTGWEIANRENRIVADKDKIK